MADFNEFDPFAALASAGSEQDPTSPAYLGVASTHTLLNSYQSPDYTWDERLSNVGKFAVSAMVSGIDSIANTAISGYNFFGSAVSGEDFQKADSIDTAEHLANIDSDLGIYYQQNKEAVDIAGFLVTSLIPGFVGVKALNVGQKFIRGAKETGLIGGTLSKFTGLLTPSADMYIANAATEIATSQATFAGINANLARGIAAGFGQATLESAVFEVAVVSTMNQSPVLDNQDISDLMTNVLIGGALGGTVGGVITTAKVFSKVKGIVKAADEAEKPFTSVTKLPTGPDIYPSDRIVQAFDDIANTPEVTQGTDYTTTHTRLREGKIGRLQNAIRTEFRGIASDDLLGNMIADNSLRMSRDDALGSYFGVREITRAGQKTAIEKQIEKDLNVLVDLDNPVLPSTGNKAVKFVQLVGDGIGNSSDTIPKTLWLADRFASDGAVNKYMQSKKFKLADGYDSRLDTDHFNAEARYLWADKIVKNMKPGTVVGDYDIPIIERAMRDGTSIKLRDSGVELRTAEDFNDYLSMAKTDTIAEHVAKNSKKAKEENKLTTEQIGKITNTRASFIEGNVAENTADDLFAKQYYDRTYTKRMIEQGAHSAAKGTIDTAMLPRYAKLAVDFNDVSDVNGNVLQGMAHIAAKAKLQQQDVLNVFNKTVGEDAATLFTDITDSDILHANRYGAGSGRISFANGNYGTFESKVESIGASTASLITKFKADTRAHLEPLARRLANNPEAAIEFEAIQQRMAGTAEKYVMNEAGTHLIPRKIDRYNKAVAAGQKAEVPKLQEGAPLEIEIRNAETLEAVLTDIEINGSRVTKEKEIRAVQGLTNEKDVNTFYPMRPDPKDYPHFAMVRDPRVNGVGHMAMIHATNEADLAALIAKVPKEYQVLTKDNTDEFFKAKGDYQYERSLHENYIDSGLQSAGINSQFFAKTDPLKIAQDWMENHLRRDAVLARELVSARYERQFEQLRHMGDQYTELSTSRYVGKGAQAGKNPYVDYIKTALNISRTDEFPLLKSLNKIISDSVSVAHEAIGTAFAKSKSLEDLEKTNNLLTKYGIQSAFNNDRIVDLIVNKNITKDSASKFVRMGNRILSTVTLRLDHLNAITNAVGANVLLGAETRYILSQLQKGNKAAVGELAALMDVAVPGVTDTIRSPSKLIARSMKNFFDKSPEGLARKDFYTRIGAMTDLSKQVDSVLTDLTVTGEETFQQLNGRLQSAYDKTKKLVAVGEKYTGNAIAEEFNRFVSADVMRQITDVALKHGVIDQAGAVTYMRTFVNRTQGNLLATQRPMLFQGPVGQAIGLFQTYQFNMLQQLLRYTAEGGAKDVATLLGLQSTLFGLNGLPAFNFVNTHIVGTASGNINHTDMYSSVYGIAGKTAGDWVLYGAPSNILSTNLYSRGDINPRQLTVVPTNPADVPLINATASFFGNLKDTVTKIGNGGAVWESLLQGIEHNTLSRPLAGLAQTLQAFDGPSVQSYSTTTKGNILGSNDLFSLASLSRLAGGKPLDEAVLNDAMFRTTVYGAKDKSRKDALGEALKSQGTAGDTIDPDKMLEFQAAYARMGGNQKQFNKWAMGQLTGANAEKANLMMKKLNTPESRYLQVILSGSTFDKLPRAGSGGVDESEE